MRQLNRVVRPLLALVTLPVATVATLGLMIAFAVFTFFKGDK